LHKNEIFDASHINEKGFVMDEITNNSDAYTANSNLSAGFVLFDNKIDRFRLTWGARIENFNQELHSFDYTNAPLDVKNTTTDILPSMNANGTNGYPDIYERHRPLLDLSIAKKMGKHGELKLNVGDLLARDFIYFQDNDASHTYTDKDNLIQNINFGTNVSLSFGYRF
jgi:hypothetical protein